MPTARSIFFSVVLLFPLSTLSMEQLTKKMHDITLDHSRKDDIKKILTDSELENIITTIDNKIRNTKSAVLFDLFSCTIKQIIVEINKIAAQFPPDIPHAILIKPLISKNKTFRLLINDLVGKYIVQLHNVTSDTIDTFAHHKTILPGLPYNIKQYIIDEAEESFKKSLEKKIVFRGHTDDVLCIDHLNSSSSYIISGSADKTIRFWDLITKKCSHIMECKNEVTSVAISPCNTLFSAATNSKKVCIWNTNTKEKMFTLIHKTAIMQVAFGENGSLLTTSRFGEAFLWQQTAAEEEYRCITSYLLGPVLTKRQMLLDRRKTLLHSQNHKIISIIDTQDNIIIFTNQHRPAFLTRTALASCHSIEQIDELVQTKTYGDALLKWERDKCNQKIDKRKAILAQQKTKAEVQTKLMVVEKG